MTMFGQRHVTFIKGPRMQNENDIPSRSGRSHIGTKMSKFMYIALALAASCVCLVQGQNITVNVDASRGPSLNDPSIDYFVDELKNDLESWYGFLRNWLWSEDYVEPGTVKIQFRENLGVNAYTFPHTGRIMANAEFFQNALDQPNNHSWPLAKGVMYHELVHVIQQNRNCPSWIYEGIADFFRGYFYQYALYPPTKPLSWAGQHYSQGYLPAAYFLNWLDTKGNFPTLQDSSALFAINKACRAGNYSDNIFHDLMGKSKDQLWEEMIYSVPASGFRVQTSNVPDHLEMEAYQIGSKMEELYPTFSKFLNSSTFEELDVIYLDFDSSMGETDVAVAPKLKGVKVNPLLIAEDGDDYTRILAGMVHVIQQYKGGEPWLFSGIGYLTVHNFYEPARAHMVKPPPGSHYTDGDWHAAYFLHWLDQRYRPFGQRMSYWLNKNCRERIYTEIDFRRFTGRTPEMLWNQMMSQ